MSPHQESATQRLLQLSFDVLDQALVLVAWHELTAAPAYAQPVGAHLRHLIEHYEALVWPSEAGVVDYDRRPRDRELERRPAVARARLEALQARLLQWTDARLKAPLEVRGQGGLVGEFDFAVVSSVGRELVFVASHAIHHFALLRAHCKQVGVPMLPEFGLAPATARHERAAQVVSPTPLLKEITCNA